MSKKNQNEAPGQEQEVLEEQAEQTAETAQQPEAQTEAPDPLLTELAGRYGTTPAQICIRFALECGICPLPKSSSPERMRQNLEVFDFALSPADFWRIASLPPVGWSGLHPDRPRAAL